MVRLCRSFRPEYHNSGDEDGACRSRWRVCGCKEDIASYIERVELYFAANYVEEDHEVATFLALIRADAYGVLRNLLAPVDRPKDKSFVELTELLVAHYSPKPILIAESFKFHRRNRLESETVAQFVVELKRLAWKHGS